jgi:hypothetical protein
MKVAQTTEVAAMRVVQMEDVTESNGDVQVCGWFRSQTYLILPSLWHRANSCLLASLGGGEVIYQEPFQGDLVSLHYHRGYTSRHMTSKAFPQTHLQIQWALTDIPLQRAADVKVTMVEVAIGRETADVVDAVTQTTEAETGVAVTADAADATDGATSVATYGETDTGVMTVDTSGKSKQSHFRFEQRLTIDQQARQRLVQPIGRPLSWTKPDHH